MSMIDSGLGWKADSNYYIYDADTLIADYNRSGSGSKAYKSVDGGAIICGCLNGNSNRYNIKIISTVQNYANFYAPDGDPNVGSDYCGSYNAIGFTWYLYDLHSGTSDRDNIPYSIEFNRDDYNYQEIVELMLDIANVEVGNKIPSTDYVKAFVEGVEAETATRVNAKQPKTISSTVSVGGVLQTTVEDAISAMAMKISKIDFDISRNLGTEITTAQKLAVANGTFEDLPIGAYWTLNDTIYRIAHHDYYLGTGDTKCTSHHIVVVPDNNMYNAKMNDTNTTAGGYANSKMRTENLATALSTFETDFGATHILNHRIRITNAVSNGQASGWAWYDSKTDLMNENMIYGHSVWGRVGYETGLERGQLALFSLYPEFIRKQRLGYGYWLRSVYSGSFFSHVAATGYAAADNASESFGVRPYACIYFDDVL